MKVYILFKLKNIKALTKQYIVDNLYVTETGMNRRITRIEDEARCNGGTQDVYFIVKNVRGLSRIKSRNKLYTSMFRDTFDRKGMEEEKVYKQTEAIRENLRKARGNKIPVTVRDCSKKNSTQDLQKVNEPGQGL